MAITSADPRRSISLPWGDGPPLPLAIPEHWEVADVAWPDLAGALGDYPSALARALDEPEGGPRIDALARPGSTVAIVVDDPSRWTPVRQALPILLDRLRARG